MSMEEGRVARFARNTELERLLKELSQLLAPAEALAEEPGLDGERPLVLICGAPRSGTTLLTQWLASSGCIAYPTNLMSRFFAAPSVGARIQQLLLDPRFAYGDELAALTGPVDFKSDLGKTTGPLAPNEFWYFWRRFLPTTDIEPLGARVVEVDFEGLRRGLAAIARVFQQPLAMKGMMVQYDIRAFAEALPGALFVHVERDVASNAMSLITSRERFFGDRDTWYSAKPPEYPELAQRSPVEQVVGQVVHTNRHIQRGTAELAPSRRLHVSYEAFCENPQRIWTMLRERLATQGCELPEVHPAPIDFVPTKPRRTDDSARIAQAMQDLDEL